jgi:hypothetical protein
MFSALKGGTEINECVFLLNVKDTKPGWCNCKEEHFLNFTLFKQAISTCLAQTHTTHRTALESLPSLRFQTFKQSQSVPW